MPQLRYAEIYTTQELTASKTARVKSDDMRYFTSFPADAICPVCNSNKDKCCALIPIDGTDSGNNCEASTVHQDCLIKAMEGLRHNKKADVLYFPLFPQE